MKRVLLVLAVMTILAASCRKQQEDQDGKKIISVSILPQKYFVEQIAGDQFQVNVMIPPGANPVTYEPTPGKMEKVSQSVAYIKTGHLIFEHVWMDKFKSMNGTMEIIDQSEQVELIRSGDHQHGNHRHKGNIDPHIWVSPKAVKLQIETIKKALIKLEPENEDMFAENYRNFKSKLDSLDASIEERIAQSDVTSFMIFHPALSYFARDYGLNQIAIESGGKEPSPSKLKEVVEEARKKEMRKVLVQKQFSTDKARTVAGEIGASVAVINPLDSNWIDAMDQITGQILSNHLSTKAEDHE